MENGQLKIAAIGLGNRTCKYLLYVKEHPSVVKLVAIVEPDSARLRAIKEMFGLPEDCCFRTYEEFTQSSIETEVCIIGTPDYLHYNQVLDAMSRGWDVLLEKPMAQTAEQCRKIAEVSEETGRLISVCYVLRYQPYFIKFKELVQRPSMGRIVSVSHIENIGNDRLAHTYVRGPWNVAEMDTTVFLSKCCHDVDFVLWLIGNDVVSVNSEGTYNTFTKENMPAQAAARCIDCPLENECRYSAVDVYVRRRDWIKGFLPAPGETKEDAVMRALKESRFGRCVYDCPTNDVIDRQVVSLEMASGIKAEIVMQCPTEEDNRDTRVECENAVVYGDESVITVEYKDGREKEVYDYSWTKGMDLHANADLHIVEDFIDAVLNDRSDVRTSAREAVVSHLICFLAEESRLSGEKKTY